MGLEEVSLGHSNLSINRRRLLSQNVFEAMVKWIKGSAGLVGGTFPQAPGNSTYLQIHGPSWMRVDDFAAKAAIEMALGPG